MKNNLDYVICPICSALYAAMWFPRGERSYDVVCMACGYEYEHGHYDSNDIVIMFDEQSSPDVFLPLTAEQIELLLRYEKPAKESE